MVENTYQCGSDNVKIFDGKNSSATLIGKYCGSHNPFSVETTTNNMFVTFRSDRSLNYYGFKATFDMKAVRPIRPMSFKRSLKDTTVTVVGEQVKFICQVKDGSLNIVISWKKDGKNLSVDKSDYTIRNNSLTKRSTLLLHKVSRNDAGEYSCTVEDVDMGQSLSSVGSLLVKGTY